MLPEDETAAVVLLGGAIVPSVAVVTSRHDERRALIGKVAYTESFGPAENDHQLAATPADLGLWLGSSEQTPEETVEAILARSEEARVDGRQVGSA